MATAIYGLVQFTDGSFAYLSNAAVTEATLTEIQTGGVGLAQVSGVSIGQAYVGKTACAAMIQVQTDDAVTGAFANGSFQDPRGSIIVPVQGGNYSASGLPRLARNVVMSTGVTFHATWDLVADTVTMASMAVVCSDGTSDVFTVSPAVDATKTAMVNKDGSSIGQALDGKILKQCYQTYPSLNGLNDNQAGNSGFYIEAADGTLKGVFPPMAGQSENVVPWIQPPVGIRITQNDTLSVMAGL